MKTRINQYGVSMAAYNIRMPIEDYEALAADANEQGVTMANIMRRLIKRHVNKRKRRLAAALGSPSSKSVKSS